MHTRIPPKNLGYDHDGVRRFGGAFTRPAATGEAVDDLLRFPEHPVVVVRPTANPHVIKRTFFAAHCNRTPWPDPLDVFTSEEFNRKLDPQQIKRWRRL